VRFWIDDAAGPEGLTVNKNKRSDHDYPVARSGFDRALFRLSQNGLAADAVPDAVLPVRLSGSGQRRLCQAADDERSGPQRNRLRVGCRRVLHRLFSLRSAQQHHPAQGRRARLDRADHDHLGHRLGAVRLRRNRLAVLRPALSAGDCRSRSGAGPAALPDLLVSVLSAGAHDRVVVYRHSAVRHGRWPAVRLDHEPLCRRARLGRLAVDVRSRGGAHRGRRPAGAELSEGRRASGDLAQ